MKRGMAVLRGVCLTLGLLLALGGSAWAQECQCFPATPAAPPVICPTHDFGGVLIGNTASQTIVINVLGTGTSVMSSITGPNAIEFSITGDTCTGVVSPAPCSLTVRFAPLGCGVRTATLTVTYTNTAGTCTLQFALVGFGCSFDCAINATQLASLSPTVRDRILRELFLAQTATGATRCFRLNCALCLILPERVRGRAGALDVELQILCLLRVFACPPAFSPVID